MKTYYVTQMWVDEDGTHNVGDPIELDDGDAESFDAHKGNWLLHQGWISLEKPPKLPLQGGDEPKAEEPEPKKRASHTHKASKKTT